MLSLRQKKQRKCTGTKYSKEYEEVVWELYHGHLDKNAELGVGRLQHFRPIIFYNGGALRKKNHKAKKNWAMTQWKYPLPGETFFGESPPIPNASKSSLKALD